MEYNIKKNIFRVFLFVLFVYSSGADLTTSEVSFIPSKYLIQIKTDESHFGDGDASKMQFEGTVTVNFGMKKPDNFEKDFHIILNTNPNGKVKESTLEGSTEVPEQLSKTNCKQFINNDKLIFNCTKEDAKFKTFKLKVEYSNPFGDDMTGLYRSSYVDSSNKTRWLLTTHFEPIFARKAFPCFDQPHLKAYFEVHLTVPKAITNVLSNTAIAKTTLKENFVTHEFKPTEFPMSTYLVAFTASDFKSTESKEFTSNYKSQSLKKKLTTHGREDIIKAKDGDFAQIAGVEALEELTKYLDLGYALEKVDQVGIPDFSAGAMENWGHISFREKSLFFNEAKSTTNTKQSNLLTITHELVHQWFGNLVTLESWDYIWLNEAFATYLEYLIASKFTKINSANWNLMEQMVVSEIHQRAFETDGSASSKPLNNKITDENLIYSSFNDIPYSKGAAVLRMWDLALKENGFQKSLRAYLKARAENSANPGHLYEAFKETAKMDESFFKSWTEQVGYPVVEVKNINGSYHLTQNHFSWENTTSSTFWQIPITYTTESSKNFSTLPSLWLSKDPITFSAKGKWIIINNQQAGYYRVNYEKENWNELSKALAEKDHSGIPELNRAQILNDVFSLARSLQKNYVHYSLALDIAKYLKNEKSLIVWKTALNAFDFLLTKLNNDAKFKMYVLSLVEPHFKGLDSISSDHVQKLMNTEIARLSCSLDSESCVEKAKTLYQNSSYTKYPDTQEIVLCTVVRNVVEAWEEVFKKYQSEKDSASKLMYISALGCTGNKTLIEEFLRKTITVSSEIRKQDLIYVLSAVYNGNIKNIDTALNFVDNNFKEIAKNYGGINPLGKAVVGIAKKLNTEDQVKKLKALIEKIKKSPEGKSATESLENAEKIANGNIVWIKERKEQFSSYFSAGSYLSYSFGLLLLCLISVVRF